MGAAGSYEWRRNDPPMPRRALVAEHMRRMAAALANVAPDHAWPVEVLVEWERLAALALAWEMSGAPSLVADFAEQGARLSLIARRALRQREGPP